MSGDPEFEREKWLSDLELRKRELENKKSNAEIVLERSKAESTRILEMIKTGDPEHAASNLEFLLQSGLISEL